MDEALLRLACACGLEPGYWDALGTRRELGAATAEALLRVLGTDPDLPEAALAAHAAQAAARALPRVVCLEHEQTPVLDLTLTPVLAGAPLAWEVQLEDGGTLCGAAQPEVRDALRLADGAERVRVRLPLGAAASIALGYHTLHVPALAASCPLVVYPARCYQPPPLAAGGRCFGLAVQLYALRSARNWGIGDFTDLAMLARIAAGAGAALIGLNPLHARHQVRPDDASPYAPSSRLMLDVLYLDLEVIDDYAHAPHAHALIESADFQARLAAARATTLVDHAAVSALKLPILRLLFETFRERCARGAATSRAAAFARFVADGGHTLTAFATFEALRLWRAADSTGIQGWREWPVDWRDPNSPALAQFRASHAADIEFQCYLQWQAELQLAAAADVARSNGMALGLYRDLAVGAADDGAECWTLGALVARGVSVGAPPDLLNRAGQDWGLPPWNPRVLEDRAYAPYAALLAANMRHAGALRIDHVMALTRLFWIPAGMSGDAGAYVRQAFDHLAGIVALESVRNRCLVIGEDLGSVPDGLREALAARGFLSYRVLLFERHWHEDGRFKRPEEYPHQALATVVTHDMPTIADYWAGSDIPRRAALGLFPDAALAAAESERRAEERRQLLALLASLELYPAADDTAALSAALHTVVARTTAMLAVVQLDDLAGAVLPTNIPGTFREYPNWRRKLELALEDLEADPRWHDLARVMRESGRANA